jgi:DNA (cytosine-5)-methyltransferase 1
MSYVDFFRPRYALMENVMGMSHHDELGRCLRALVAIGYQVAFGALHAGNFGVPQARRRYLLMYTPEVTQYA